MNSTPLHPKALTKLPDMAVYGPGVAGSVKRKTLVTVPPIQGSEFKPTGQRVIQIFLPKNGFLNGVNSYLTFKHSCDPCVTDPANPEARYQQPALSTSASNWIQRMRIKVGGRIVEDIDDYNVLHEIVKCTVVSQPFRDSLAGQCEGYEPEDDLLKQIEPCNVTESSLLPDTLPQYLANDGKFYDLGWTPAVGTINTQGYVGPKSGLNSHLRTSIIRGGVRVNVNRTGNVKTEDLDNDRYAGDADHTLQRWAREGRYYQIKLLSGFLESRRYLPLRFMPPVEIELTLADFQRSHVWAPATMQNYAVTTNTGTEQSPVWTSATQDLESAVNNGISGLNNRGIVKASGVTGTYAEGKARPETAVANQTYRIEAVNYVAEMLEFDETFYQAFEMSLAQGVTIPYTTFTNHVFAHTGGSADIQVAERVRSAKSIFAVMRRNKDLAYPAYPKFLFSQNGLDEFQVKIGTQYFPMQPIKVGEENGDLYSGHRLLELSKCVAAMSDTTHAMTIDAQNHTEKFIIGMDLDREFNRLSGLDTTKGLPLYLNLKHRSTPVDTLAGKPCALNVFVHYDMFVDLFPGEVVEVLN